MHEPAVGLLWLNIRYLFNIFNSYTFYKKFYGLYIQLIYSDITFDDLLCNDQYAVTY